MFRSTCLICGSEKISKIIDIGIHPFADTFISKEKLHESDLSYPLYCDLCQKCGQIQNSCITNPIDRYSLHDYSYTSSNSAFSRNHWEKYANEVSKKLNLTENSFIIEIGSNDGYLAEQLLKRKHKVLGVDPSQYMADLAKERGVETVVELFNSETGIKIINLYGKADLIIANNVFNHSNEPLEFVKTVSELLKDNGTFLFELPYWYYGLKSKKFDQIYHEHVSYFTVKSSFELLKRANLVITDIDVVDYHGGSLRVFVKKKDFGNESDKVISMIYEEESLGVFELSTYHNFMSYINCQKHLFLKKIHNIKSEGGKIIAVGAAAKGNTFLNFYNLDNNVIDYVTDSSPHKQGKYTPLTRIPIVDDNVFSKYDKVYALILSWNISDKLKKVLNDINPNIEFLNLPE